MRSRIILFLLFTQTITLYGLNTVHEADSIFSLAQIIKSNGNVHYAIQKQKEGIAIMEQSIDGDAKRMANARVKLAEMYIYISSFTEAMMEIQKADSIYRHLKYEETSSYADLLVCKAIISTQQEKFSEGISLAQRAVLLYEKDPKSTTNQLIEATFWVIVISNVSSNTVKVHAEITRLADLLMQLPAKEIFNHQEHIMQCIQCLLYVQQSEKALSLINRTLDILAASTLHSNPFVLTLKSTRANAYLNLNRLDEALIEVLEIISVAESSLFFNPNTLDEIYLILADIYSRKDEYALQLAAAEKAYSLANSRNDDRRMIMLNAKSFIAGAYNVLENKKAAYLEVNETLKLVEQLKLEGTIIHASALQLKAEIEQLDNPMLAIEDSKNAKEILLKQDPIPYDRVEHTLSFLYKLYTYVSLSIEAKNVLSEIESLSSDMTLPSAMHAVISLRYHILCAEESLNNGLPQKGVINLKKAKELSSQFPGMDMTLINIGLAKCYAQTDDIAQAKKTIDTLLIELEQIDTKRLQYSQALQAAAYVYALAGNASLMKQYQSQSLQIMADIYGKESITYNNALVNNAYQLAQLGFASEAYTYCKEAEKKLYMCFQEDDINLYLLYTTMIMIEQALGKNDNAILYGLKAKRIAERYNSQIALCEILCYLGNCYNVKFQFNEALKLLNQADEIVVRLEGNFSLRRASIFQSLASVYQSMGDFSQSETYYSSSYEIIRRVADINHPNYLYAILYEAKQEWGKGHIEGAREKMRKAVETIKNSYGNDNPYSLKMESYEASLLINEGDVEGAIKKLEHIVAAQKKKNHYDDIESMGTLAMAYGLDMQFNKQVELTRQILSIFNNKYGKDSQQAGMAYVMLANAYRGLKNERKCAENSLKAFTISRNTVLQNFLLMTKKERTDFWNTATNFFTEFLPYSCASANKHEEFTALTYDAALISKGLLLEAETNIVDLIRTSSDSVLENEYMKFEETRQLYQNATIAYSPDASLEERIVSVSIIDSLKKEMSTQEHLLMEHIRERFGDYTSNLAIVWSDVQNVLKNDEIAIEFLSTKISQDSTRYFALVITKGCKSPIYIDVCAQGESDSIWHPIFESFPKVQNVYFSPCGELYNLPIESYFSKKDNIYWAEKYNFYRLSSTRELVLKYQHNNSNTISLYGNIAYGATKNDLKRSMEKYKKQLISNSSRSPRITYFDATAIIRSADIVLDSLPGTAIEVDSIVSLVNSNPLSEISAHPYVGVDATESSVKALSGEETRVVHIATHGFYYPAALVTGDDFIKSILSIEDKGGFRTYDSEEDLALQRCGLYMAGAENKINGDSIVGIDDGILTAKEISMLNFNGMELAVLSACETGLGDISSEGVWGLQRGFKKAGTNSLLMSLWKVDDDATCELMTEFYRQWIQNRKTKHQALELAKQKVRSHKEKGWNNPTYWAAFVLLDGLN